MTELRSRCLLAGHGQPSALVRAAFGGQQLRDETAVNACGALQALLFGGVRGSGCPSGKGAQAQGDFIP
eukprot:15440031-Alexandrium_andersonii.AAC.1